MNPAPHWTTSNTARPDEVKKHNWGRVPFIPVFNNPHGTTDLEKIKNRIDAIDKIESGWCNDLEDFQEMVYIVKNMQGMTDEERGGLTEIGKAMQQMKTQKMILVGSDGGVETLKADIPVDAKERFIALMRRGIFTIGQGVDPELVGDGNITNVVIQSRYAGLNMKCDSFLQELESALNEFMWFVVEWINRQYNKKFNYEDIVFTFKKAEVINQSEMITDLNAVYNTGNLDRRTYLENVYFIKDPEAVIKRLEQERKEKIESGIVDLDSIPDEQIPGSVENKLESLNLNGAQVTAAGNIVAQAMSKAVSRDSALNQLQVFFGLTKEQAESILGQAEE
jgi:SPP1 family phage portal protein